MSFPKFYPIAPDAETAIAYINAGIYFLQIRIKDMPQEMIEESLQKVIPYAQKHGSILVVNDYWQEAINYGADYVHLGQEDLCNADIDALKKANISLGISTHDQKELDNALSHNPDYIALGPIYHTQLKAMKCKPQGLEKIGKWKHQIGSIPLVAIGGITLEKAEIVLDSGADCISVVTDITLAQNPQDRLDSWISFFQNRFNTF